VKDGPSIHATAILLGGRGVLIEGAPGSGKSTLARLLIAAARASGADGVLVSDDRTLIEAAHGRLIARPPVAIRGLLEVAGLGLIESGHAPAAVVDIVLALVAPQDMARMPEPGTAIFAEVGLPRLAVPQRQAMQALAIASAHPLFSGVLSPGR
jgi:HPr kinase/phosphorylase